MNRAEWAREPRIGKWERFLYIALQRIASSKRKNKSNSHICCKKPELVMSSNKLYWVRAIQVHWHSLSFDLVLLLLLPLLLWLKNSSCWMFSLAAPHSYRHTNTHTHTHREKSSKQSKAGRPTNPSHRQYFLPVLWGLLRSPEHSI